MKKSILALLFAAAVATVAVMSCKKEDTEFEKGKKDGKAYCDCIQAAVTSGNPIAALGCLGKIDMTKAESNEEYAKGLEEGTKGCGGMFD